MRIDLEKEVRNAARGAAARWPNTVEADDVEQEIWLYILENPKYKDFLEVTDPTYVKKALRKKANSICSKTQLDYMQFSGQYMYNVGEVTRLLKETQFLTLDVRSVGPEVRADLSVALEQLKQSSEAKWDVLYQAFCTESLSTDATARKRKSRALTELTNLLNIHCGCAGDRPEMPEDL